MKIAGIDSSGNVHTYAVPRHRWCLVSRAQHLSRWRGGGEAIRESRAEHPRHPGMRTQRMRMHTEHPDPPH